MPCCGTTHTLENMSPETSQLDLPGDENLHYRFIAEKRAYAWCVDAKVKRPDLKIRFGTPLGLDENH
jgi:hypothetical protein